MELNFPPPTRLHGVYKDDLTFSLPHPSETESAASNRQFATSVVFRVTARRDMFQFFETRQGK